MSILPEGTVCGLAEVVLRVSDIDQMQNFYHETLGLQLRRRFGNDMVFFKLPGTSGSRAQGVALFVEQWPSNATAHRWAGLDASQTTMHHFALNVTLDGLDKARRLLQAAGVEASERTFPWVGWRSLMLRDPAGNVVELVADDPTIIVLATESD